MRKLRFAVVILALMAVCALVFLTSSAYAASWRAEFTSLSGTGPGGFTSPYTSPDGGGSGNFTVLYQDSLPSNWLTLESSDILRFNTGTTSSRGRFGPTHSMSGNTGFSVGYRLTMNSTTITRGPIQVCLYDTGPTSGTMYNCYVKYDNSTITILQNGGAAYPNINSYSLSGSSGTYKNWCLAVKVSGGYAHWILWADGVKLLFGGTDGQHTDGGVTYSFRTAAGTFTAVNNYAYIGLGNLHKESGWSFRYDWVRWQNAGPIYFGDPWVTTNPTSQTKCAGDSVTFSAAGTSSGTIGYQWQVNSGSGWSNISGATAANYSFTTASGDNGKQYRCRLSNNTTSGTEDVVFTNAATLTVNTTPTPTISAASSVCAGSTGNTATITNPAGGTYAWTISGGTITAGSTSTTVTYTAGTGASLTLYATQTAGGCTSAQGSKAVTITALPVAPTSAINNGPIYEGSSATLTATGGSGTTLRWMTGSCGGTSVGTGNDLVVSPTQNTTYYVRWENDCGDSTCESTTVMVNPLPIGEAKKRADAADVILSGKTVTAVFTDHFYIQDDSSSGIRVAPVSMPTGLAVGDTVDVVGTLATTSDSERVVVPTSVDVSAGSAIAPVLLTNKNLGGGDFFYDPGNGAGQIGVEDGVGVNNIGLLVKTCGTVTAVGDTHFYIDDGTHARDFSLLNGIRVRCGALTKPSSGDHVCVSGISSIMKVNGRVFRSITPRDDDDF